MRLIRWQPATPARDLLRMQGDMDRLIESVFGATPSRGALGMDGSPAVDIEENADGFVLRADLPGVPQKDVKVSLHGDLLTLRGERVLEKERAENGTHRVERFSGAFERSFTLGVPVRADQVKATYRDGVLEIRVPKAEEARTREIEIQVASN
jgi:HSP20 family protein